MNPLNYCTLEAAQHLVDAGIVLETEAVWHLSGDNETFFLETRGSSPSLLIRWGDFPAPCMAEVWRELPSILRVNKMWSELRVIRIDNLSIAGYWWNTEVIMQFAETNLTNALIDLLIWVRKEKKV